MGINLKKLPDGYRDVPEKFWQSTPPIFTNGIPSPDDIELVRKLFLLLDERSRRWYKRNNPRLFDGLE